MFKSSHSVEPIKDRSSCHFAQRTRWSKLQRALYAQCHDRVDNIVVILLQCLDSLLSRDGCLLHDQLDILALQVGLINFFAIVFILILLVIVMLNGLALAVAARAVIVACVLIDLAGLNNLLGSGVLSL